MAVGRGTVQCVLVVLVALSGLAPAVAAAAAVPGLDPSFGREGIYRLDLTKPSIDVANAAIEGRAGLIGVGSAGGRFALGAFGRGGGSFNLGHRQVIVDFGLPSAAHAIMGLSDLTAVGAAGDDFAVARLDRGGDPVMWFGDLGRVRTSFGAPAVAYAVADLGYDGAVAAGTVRSGAGSSVALAAYDRFGALDPTFGDGGKVVDDVSPGDDATNAVAVTANGLDVHIWVAGRAGPDGFVARYRGDGSRDPNFGSGGRMIVDLLPGDDVIEQLYVDSGGGGMVVAGSAGNVAYIARLTAQGTLDPAFGDGGMVRATFPGSAIRLRKAVWDQHLSRVTFTVAVTGPDGVDAVLARYRMDGTPDTAFGTGGRTVVDLGSGADRIGTAVWIRRGDDTQQLSVVGGDGADMVAASVDYTTGTPWAGQEPFDRKVVDFGAPTYEEASAMAVQADGRILLAGHGTRGTIVVRLLPNGSPDPSFGTAGVSVVPIGTRPRAIALVRGRILVFAYRDEGPGLLGLTLGGAVDKTYGDRGWAGSGIDAWTEAPGFGVLPDGVVVGGGSQVVRLNDAGRVVWSVPVGDYYRRVVDVAVQPDGRTAVLLRDRYQYGATLVRLKSDGSTDETFSNSTWLVGSPVRAVPGTLLLLPDGRFVVGALTDNGPLGPPATPELVAAGFTAQGQMDPAFGTNGVTRTAGPDVERGAIDLLHLGDGRIVAVAAPDPSRIDVATLVRYLPDGRLDTSLGNEGVATVPGVDPRMGGVSGDGRILVAGGTVDPWDMAVVMARPLDAGAPAVFHPLGPVRVLDTRSGLGAPAAKLGPGSTLSLQVAGRAGVPTSGVSAVVLNVTATNPTAVSYLTAWPRGRPRPTASNLNVSPGQSVANLVVVKVGDAGRVDLYNNAGSTDLVADLAGWYGDDGTGGGSRYTPLTPSRVLDTRSGLGAPAAKVGPGATIGLQVTGRGGVPASGVAAVVLNVTATDPTSASHLTAWSAGTARPLASNLNYTSGQTVPNLVMVEVGTGGVVNLYNSGGFVHLIADVAGWYGVEGAGGGSLLSPVVPARILDTRIGLGAPAAKVGAGATLSVQVAGQGGVPLSGVSAVVVNVTVTEPTAPSHLTVLPAGEPQPVTSNLNYSAGQTVPNLVVVKVGAAGRVDLFNAGGSAHVIADVAGWYG